MKKIFTLLFAVLYTAFSYGQAPSKMSYQAVVRGQGNLLVTNSPVGMRISILQGSTNGTPIYVETQNTQTNLNGLISLQIGSGINITGDFSLIDWANGPYFIKTETDPLGATDYSVLDVTELLSVPYAMYAETSGSSIPGPVGPAGNDGLPGEQGQTGNDGPPGPVGFLSAGNAEGVTPFWNGSNWVVSNSNIYNNGSSIGIGTNAPDASAKLDVNSTTQLFLPPRMTQTQRDAIVSPASGGILFNSTTKKLQSYIAGVSPFVDGTGSAGAYAQYDGPAQGQTIEPLSTGILTSIDAQVAIRGTSDSIQVNIYDGVNGNLIATADNKVSAPWAGSEFNFQYGTWTFSNANFMFTAGTTYYIEFTATTGIGFFIGTSYTTYLRGDLYTGMSGTVSIVTDGDIDFAVHYGGSPASWVDLY